MIRFGSVYIEQLGFFILVNGFLTGFFQSKGFKAKGSLSLYLFVLVMEPLSILLRNAGEGHFISGFKVRGRRRGVEISHLLFTDDTLLFYEPCLDQLICLSLVLFWFEAFSALKINLYKSELIPMGRSLMLRSLPLY